MVQLELNPEFMATHRTAGEITFYRSQILSRKSHPVSLEYTLSDLGSKAEVYFWKLHDGDGNDFGQWVSAALSRSLKFLQGEKGHFKGLAHFERTMFDKIIFHLAVDRHRQWLRQQGKSNNPDSFPSKEMREYRAAGFQPSLFSIQVRQGSMKMSGSDELMMDLADPDRVLGSQLPEYVKRALQLSEQNGFTAPQIVDILKEEGFGKFSNSAVRVWRKRIRDNASGKLTLSQPA